MQLACCNLSKHVGLVTISVETGYSVKRVKKFLDAKGVKRIVCQDYLGHCVYDSRLVREAFRDVVDYRDQDLEGN
ncbi:hypothetical protein KAR91_38375 [Candidatus Pacearchaeota archaeon]|nr:hypothetical protein [Candidatus Pacearchaeota archaeon]